MIHNLSRATLCALLLVCALALDACGSSIPFFSDSDATDGATTPTPTIAKPTPEPTPEPTPIVLGEKVEVETGGYSIQHPPGWYSTLDGHTLLLSSSEAAMTATSPGDDPVILIDSTPLEHATEPYTGELDVDIAALFAASSKGPEQAGYSVSSTTPITVDGLGGLKATLSADGGAGTLIVVPSPPQLVRILGQAAPAAWEQHEAAFNAIVQSMRLYPPPAAATPTPVSHASQPAITRNGDSAEFVLRVGGNTGEPDARFISARGLDAGPDGVVYLAESNHGVWVFAPDGKLLSTFGANDLLLDAYDVDRAPNGDLFVADYGRNAIARFTREGNLVHRWGEIGDEAHQFGLQSPQRIAVGADGSVYALDSHIDTETRNTVSSVVRFHGDDGRFIERIGLPSGSAPNDLAVDMLGNIYLAEATGGFILKLDPSGSIVERFGEDVSPGGITAGAIDLDREGNIYVATWDDGIVVLASDGTLLTSIGSMAEPGTVPEPGQFSLPNGIATAPSGIVWVSDNTGEYSAITAMRIGAQVSQTNDGSAQQPDQPSQPVTATMTISTTDLLHQWAVDAQASSSYGEEYGPDGATGPPDVEGCKDDDNAWASATPNTLETLELDYETPVFATQVNVYQNHQPGFITQVEVRDEQGDYTTVYSGTAKLHNVCPYMMQVSFTPTLFRVNGVKLTIDQRKDANWSEIDAVELVGVQ